MRMSVTISELAKALAIAQGEMEDASKSAKNGHFNSKYADMASVRDVIRLPLSKAGLAIVQFPRVIIGSCVEVETMLLHTSGEFLAETLVMPLGKQDAHGVGSAITYARRYGIMSILCLASEDDDGNTAAANAVPEADQTLIEDGNDAAEIGSNHLKAWWADLSAADRLALGADRLARWKEKAKRADSAAKNTGDSE